MMMCSDLFMPQVYKIKVIGHLSSDWVDWFNGTVDS